MTLYSYHVYDQVREDGVGVFLSRGELVSVGRETFVRMPLGNVMVAADDAWTACRHEAKRRAAAKVRAMADKLSAQAERLMQQADSEQRAEELQRDALLNGDCRDGVA